MKLQRRLTQLARSSMGLFLALFCIIMMFGSQLVPMTASAHNANALSPTLASVSTPNPIQVENSKPGTPGWDDFNANLAPDFLSGYGSKISVTHGESLDFFVTTTTPSVSIDIFRTGWYGGVGARQITSLGTFPGIHQAMPTPDPTTGIIVCDWIKTTTLTIPSDWVTGVYVAKLTAATGEHSFIFFVVRNDGGHEALVFQTSVTTYQAYNNWGGTSLYANTTDKTIYPYAHATKVSFDRPFNPSDNSGTGHYFSYEYQFVRWMESQGYDATYTTDVDTDTNVNPLTNHKAFLSVGHDEYWSKGMRDNVQNAISAGVNVAFFSANSVYWQIRFESNAAGVADRVEVGYKDFATTTTLPGPDPMWHNNDALVTTNWRDSSMVNLPENGLLGEMYEAQDDQSYPFVVQNASSWVYAGTGFVDGSSVPGIVGYEYDKVYDNGATPPGLVVLGNSPVVACCGIGNSYSNATLYTAPSGARVFASGTIEWSWGLDNSEGRTFANAGIQKATANILNNFTSDALTGATPVVYFQDGFEGGNFSNWNLPSDDSNGTRRVQSSVVNTGSKAATFTNKSGQYGYIYTALPAAQAQTFTRFYFRIAKLKTRGTMLALARNASGTNVWEVDYNAKRHGLDIAFWNGAGTAFSVYSSQNVINTGTWYSLELQINQASTGHAQAWLNGASIGTVDDDLSMAQPYDRLMLYDNAVGTISFDDVIVSNTYNGLVLTAPGAALNSASLNFGNQDVNSSSAVQKMKLTNTGNSALHISSIALSGANTDGFTLTNNCPQGPNALAPGAACTIKVTFTPTAAGSSSASVVVTDDAPDSPQSATLAGTGITS